MHKLTVEDVVRSNVDWFDPTHNITIYCGRHPIGENGKHVSLWMIALRNILGQQGSVIRITRDELKGDTLHKQNLIQNAAYTSPSYILVDDMSFVPFWDRGDYWYLHQRMNTLGEQYDCQFIVSICELDNEWWRIIRRLARNGDGVGRLIITHKNETGEVYAQVDGETLPEYIQRYGSFSEMSPEQVLASLCDNRICLGFHMVSRLMRQLSLSEGVRGTLTMEMLSHIASEIDVSPHNSSPLFGLMWNELVKKVEQEYGQRVGLPYFTEGNR